MNSSQPSAILAILCLESVGIDVEVFWIVAEVVDEVGV